MNAWTLTKLEAFFDTWYSIANGFGLQVRRDHWSRASIEVEMALVRKVPLIQRGTNLQSMLAMLMLMSRILHRLNCQWVVFQNQ